MSFPTLPPNDVPPPAAFSRPFGVVILALINACGAVLYLGCALLLVLMGTVPDTRKEDVAVLGVIGGVIALIGIFHAVTAAGLFQLKGYGRICQMIQSAVGLLGIPFGTIVSAMVLYYLTRPGTKLLFSGRPPAAMTAEERESVARDSKSGVVVAVVAIILLVGVVAMVGIVAAIAIPGFLRARMSGNEASAIAAMRAMSSAQTVHAAAHDGRYTSAADPGPRDGYRFTLRLSSDQSQFVYWAEPERVDTTGSRAFCVTQSGTVFAYQARDVFPPPDADAGCPAGGRTL